MVSYTEYMNHSEVCFYSREQSVKCAACLRHRRECDGTFSVEELRKIGEQKKQLSAKSRAKRREIARLRKTLVDARRSLAALECEMAKVEEEDSSLQDSITKLDEVSSNMLKREMMALGAFDKAPARAEVALAEPNFVWQDAPLTESVDWNKILNFEGSSQPAAG
ncbi:hypothetical protein A1O7_01422 [Cladophialophora yegresii CBS 114405]|uniref:Uncharacterized protein n=1 Tax=Cladophialophora yegresii CBS 114405 TaxID=1182544 RepID=W9WAD2_9EURO|nr:uncharacterized protein A1O7_01422 [Cladophialophora yegresii CBS 114405]EXJ65082.1 hypothetical protein A1O7_01422 [Cladophialophora yegresii CBS 114405]